MLLPDGAAAAAALPGVAAAPGAFPGGPLPPLLSGLPYPAQGLLPPAGGPPPPGFVGGPLLGPPPHPLGAPDDGGGAAAHVVGPPPSGTASGGAPLPQTGPPPSWTLEGRGRAEGPPRPGGPHGGRNLYIHNVSKEARESDVRAFFGQCGEVESVALRVNQRVGPNAVYAFVLYKKPEDARLCFETFNGKTFSELRSIRKWLAS